MSNCYICSECGKIFEKGWSDEEAEKEWVDNFGNIPVKECAVVCDDCYMNNKLEK